MHVKVQFTHDCDTIEMCYQLAISPARAVDSRTIEYDAGNCREVVSEDLERLCSITRAASFGVDNQESIVTITDICDGAGLSNRVRSVEHVFTGLAHIEDSVLFGIHNPTGYRDRILPYGGELSWGCYKYPRCYDDMPRVLTMRYHTEIDSEHGEVVIPLEWCASIPITSHVLYLMRMWGNVYRSPVARVIAKAGVMAVNPPGGDYTKYAGVNRLFVQFIRECGPATVLSRYHMGWWATLYALLAHLHNDDYVPLVMSGVYINGFMSWLDVWVNDDDSTAIEQVRELYNGDIYKYLALSPVD